MPYEAAAYDSNDVNTVTYLLLHEKYSQFMMIDLKNFNYQDDYHYDSMLALTMTHTTTRITVGQCYCLESPAEMKKRAGL